MKIFLLSNIPTPYQMDLVEELSVYCDFRAYFLWEREPGREWNLAFGDRKFEVAEFHRSPRGYLRFWRTIIGFAPDAIIIGGFALPCSDLAVAASRRLGCPVCFWLERPNHSSRLKSFFINAYLRLRLRAAAGVMAIGSDALATYARYCGNAVCQPYAIALNRYRANPHPVLGKVKFLFAGQLIPRKGIEQLLAAFRGLPTKDAELTIAGSGPLKAKVEAAAGIDDRIRIAGFVEPEKLPKLYASHDVFVMPSLYDGWGMVIPEAMASCVPCIASPFAAAAHDLVRHGENGYLCPPVPEAIRAGMEFYLAKPELAPIHGAAARADIEKSNSTSVIAAERIIAFISHLQKRDGSSQNTESTVAGGIGAPERSS
jgi:glycosyltransferase involved in cell wall biosynthesis